MAGYKIISSDSHVFEARDLWTTRMEPRYRERAPQIVRLEDGDWWYCDGLKLLSVQPGAQPGKRFDDPEHLTRVDVWENVRLGGYIPEEHVKDMEIDGIGLSVVYPTIGLLLFAVPDGELLSAIFKTYNDWVAEFCQPFPDKIKAIGVVNLDDVQEGVRELERCAKMGLVGAMITTYPPHDRPFISSDYEPFWSAAEDLEMPLSLHAATNRGFLFNAAHTRMSYLVNMDYWIRMSLSDMCLSGVLERHPKLKIGAVEYELSWIPPFLNRLDYAYTQRPKASTQYRLKEGMVPSDCIRQNVFFGFQEDARGIQDRRIIGVDNLLWGSDYPHQESTFPRSQQILKEILADCTEEEKVKIYNRNGARIYHLD